MRSSLVIIAALCVIAAAEASSVRFVSVDEGQNGKDNVHRREVTEETDPTIQEKVEDAVKKINDGGEELEKTVKSLDADRSSTGDQTPESAGEGLKKAASSEKSKVKKRDVRRTLEQLAKRGMKRAQTEEANIFSARKIIIKYLSLQKAVISKITASLTYAVEQLESDPAEKEALVAALKTFQQDIEQAYDNTINSLGSRPGASDMYSSAQGKFMRADDLSALMTTMNQRNPFAIIPLVVRLINGIAGAASIADMATSFGTRSNIPDIASVIETIQKLLPLAIIQPIPELM